MRFTLLETLKQAATWSLMMMHYVKVKCREETKIILKQKPVINKFLSETL